MRKIEDRAGSPCMRRRVVERFLTWINSNRRLAKEDKATNASADAFL